MGRAELYIKLEKLVRYFEKNIHQMKAPTFNEAQARQQLIDPFFEALGWDVRNRNMLPPHMAEVLPEGRVRTSLNRVVKEQTVLFETESTIHEAQADYASMLEYIAEDEYKAEARMATKKPDYRFRLGGTTKFFVEAKKPSVDIISNRDAIFQVKRYGFSARVPVSILTNFEQFRVFDCTRKPFYEKPKIGVLKEFDLPYTSYLDDFDKLYDTFSHEAVVAGSLETLQKKYLDKKKGEYSLDNSFLDDLSTWRVELAQDIAKHPKNRRIITSNTLNECVQRILDRIVFLRVCEDRSIEETGTLLALLRLWQDHTGLSLYEQFNKLINTRRSLYNGLLFAEHQCEQLEVGNVILEKIFKNVNYPLSPYHFEEIGVEILGSIYERFLGKTIRLTEKQVRVEDKPEVRKAGGVYYTPQYIVNYIVENTLGKLLYGEKRPGGSSLLLSPKKVSKLRIVDIACGSGSFLLGAFQKLIDYHIEWYTQHPKDIEERHGVLDAYKDLHGLLRLSSRKKREILVNNIYGVDIDLQAVEVTQMSLYLKVLEDENDATLNKPTMLAIHEVLLPPLKNNIKCGNSLIGTDFESQGNFFDDATRHKVNPFDWDMEFKEIIGNGGFDVVIGNPPWVDIKGLEPLLVEYYFSKYKTAENRINVYAVFIEKALDLLIPHGLFGYIIPNSILTQSSYTKLRKKILDNFSLENIVRLPDGVFENVVAETVVLTISKEKTKQNTMSQIVIFDRKDDLIGITLEKALINTTINPIKWKKNDSLIFNIFSEQEHLEIVEKIGKQELHLEAICDFTLGITPYDKYKGHTKEQIANRIFHANKQKDKSYKKLLSGEGVRRYLVYWGGKEWIKYGEWLGAPREERFFKEPRIIVRQILSGYPLRIFAGYTEEILYNAQIGFNILLKEEQRYSLKYVLGILNSAMMNFYHKHNFLDQSKEVCQKILIQDAKKFPIRPIDFTNSKEKKMHDDLVAFVDTMLQLNKQLQQATFDSEKEPIQRQIAATDKKIDQLVYKLYNLTDEEIQLIEM